MLFSRIIISKIRQGLLMVREIAFGKKTTKRTDELWNGAREMIMLTIVLYNLGSYDSAIRLRKDLTIVLQQAKKGNDRDS